MAFPNFYYKRTAATPKACYICYKPTATVLATIDTTDFFYTCSVHLTDRGFATRVSDPELETKKDKAAANAEEIAKVKQEWEEKQRLKKAKEKKAEDDGKEDNTDNERKDAGEEKNADTQRTKAGGSQEPETAPVSDTSRSSSSESPSDSRPTHERYVLHRDIFALRATDHRRRRQAAQAKDLAPRLPGAPSSSLPRPSNDG